MKKEPPTLRSQQQLINGLRENDPAVVKHLYKQNYPKVLAFVRKDGGNRAQAEDVIQEAFIKVWSKVKENGFEAKNETALSGYLYRVAKNKWTDHLRSFHHKKMTSLNKMEQSDDQQATNNKEDERLLQDKRLQNAIEAFEQMDGACASILKKFYFEKMSMVEIAEELQLNPKSMRNKKYQCLKKLRELFIKLEERSDNG